MKKRAAKNQKRKPDPQDSVSVPKVPPMVLEDEESKDVQNWINSNIKIEGLFCESNGDGILVGITNQPLLIP